MNNWRWTEALLYIFPFVNIFNNRGGNTLILIIISIIILLMIFSSINRGKYSKDERRVMMCGSLLMLSVVVILIFSLEYNIDNFDGIRFFCAFPFFFPLFIRMRNIGGFFSGPFIRYLRYLIVLITLSIIVDFILMQLDLVTWQPMYNEEQVSYLTRPFGLFGQPSVNSSLLCLFYIMHSVIIKHFQIKYKKDWLFLIVLLGCILQGSGSGFISLGIAIFCKYGAKGKSYVPFRKIIPYAILTLLGLVAVVLSNKIDKLSLNYIKELISFTKIELWQPYLEVSRQPISLWFGIKQSDIGIDFGPLYLISIVGLFYFIVISIFSLYLFKNAKSVEMKSAIVLLLVANLHYPVMFYFIMNAIWFFICYFILVNEHEKKC